MLFLPGLIAGSRPRGGPPVTEVATFAYTLDNPNAYGTSASDFYGWRTGTAGAHTVVSAYKEDDAGGIDSGKVYIHDTVTGTVEHTLDNPNAYGTSAGELFGEAIAVSPSYTVVGVETEDEAGVYPDGVDSGKAYIFNNSTGALVHTLSNPNPYAGNTSDRFGHAVAITDTYTVVSAWLEDQAGAHPAGIDSGKAYIYNTVTGALLNTISNPNAYDTPQTDRFGGTVAITDTYTVISAYLEDDASGSSSGKVYMFNTVTGALLHTLDNPNPYGTSTNDSFGSALAVSNLYTVIGAEAEDDAGGSASGKAYIYSNSTGALLHTLDNPNLDGLVDYDSFGRGVSITDTYTLVSAPVEHNAIGVTDYTGKAYIFNTATGTLIQTLDNPNAYGTSFLDEFGTSVAISDTHVVIGAQLEDDASGTDSGKAYVYSLL